MEMMSYFVTNSIEMIDIALILAFLWFGLSLVQWTDKQDN